VVSRGPARPAGQLGRTTDGERSDCGTGSDIKWRRGSRGPCGRTRRGQRSSASLHAHIHRRLPLDRLGLGGNDHCDCDHPTVSNQLSRSHGTRRQSAAGAHEGLAMPLRTPILAVLLSIVACAAWAQQLTARARRPTTRGEAVALARPPAHAVRLAHVSVDDKSRAKEVARSAYFPQIRNETRLAHLTDTQVIAIPAGGFGSIGGTAVP